VSGEPFTFAFIDLSGYTALTEGHGDDSAAEAAARLYDLAARSLRGDTRVVKRTARRAEDGAGLDDGGGVGGGFSRPASSNRS
jgi:hypothetical protein